MKLDSLHALAEAIYQHWGQFIRDTHPDLYCGTESGMAKCGPGGRLWPLTKFLWPLTVVVLCMK